MIVNRSCCCLFCMIQLDNFLYHLDDKNNMEIIDYKEGNNMLNLEDMI